MTKLEKVIKGLESIHAVALDKEQLYVNHMSMKDFNELLADALELLKAKDINVPTKWVSVKDRLPTPDKDVLTLDSQGNYYIDYVLRDGSWQDTKSEWNPVKWWTPLPEPPKEERE